ncbi:MAG: 5-(carboxyamino)imidazole ribonucleotide mutase [Pseudohongiellaceae bacterium]|nr:5-(carboxyamino)imidazole ribonucleotide mutase [Pseudohongiellaceae bacterium]
MNASQIEIIMGSQSDWEVMQEACTVLDALNVPYNTRVVSAHRTPKRMFEFASNAHVNGTKIIIAGAGGAAHLPGMVAALTPLPVIGVPVQSKHLKGMDSLLSIAQMPRGVAVATQAIGAAGAFNAGLLAAQILSLHDAELQERLIAWRSKQTDSVVEEIK